MNLRLKASGESIYRRGENHFLDKDYGKLFVKKEKHIKRGFIGWKYSEFADLHGQFSPLIEPEGYSASGPGLQSGGYRGSEEVLRNIS